MTMERPRWCRHHSMPKPMQHACALGVDVDALVTEQCGDAKRGRHYMLPCHGSQMEHIRKASCSQCSPYTDEEQAAIDDEIERDTDIAFERLQSTLPMISKIKSGQELTGSEPCPACHTGSVHWIRSNYNNHVAMRCSTPDCINFIE